MSKTPLTNSAAKVTRNPKPAAPQFNTNNPTPAAPIRRQPIGQGPAKRG